MVENKEELLKFILESGTIDLAYVQEQMAMQKRKEILQGHKYSIWYSESEEAWYTTVPDYTKKTGRKNIKRKKRDDLEKSIVDHYISQEDIDKKEVITLEKLFYKFMKHKMNEVGSSTIKRMKADWERFYVSEKNFIKMPMNILVRQSRQSVVAGATFPD